MKLPLEGGCRCDEVRIRLTAAPLMTAACHCNGCQRMASSAFSLTAMCRTDTFSVIKGNTVVGGIHGPELEHHFCPRCMSWMFTRITAYPAMVNVRPTMFDDHAWFEPFIETFTKTKLPWARTEAVRSFEEFPPMETFDALMKEYASRQEFHLDDTARTPR